MPAPGLDSQTKADLIDRFFPGTGASYDRVVRVTTLGMDSMWKRRVLDLVPRESKSILDLACGTGILTFGLRRRCPDARIVGVDITEDYLKVARAKHARLGGPIEFHLGDAQEFPLAAHGPFDCVTSCYIPKYVDADRLLRNLAPALAPGARVVFHDFTYPRGTLPRWMWRGYFQALDPLASRLFPEWEKVFDRSLKDLIVRSKWVDEFLDAFRRHGYQDVERIRMWLSYAAIVTARRP
jgi:demethylmenaquinone methyltransferase/2-methoxy-6-polyprenyl-1,4-benzoquinol methylase